MNFAFTTDRTFGIFLCVIYSALIGLLLLMTLSAGSDRYVPGGIMMILCLFPVTLWAEISAEAVFGLQVKDWALLVFAVLGFYLNNCLIYFCGSGLVRLFRPRPTSDLPLEMGDMVRQKWVKTYLLILLTAALVSIPVVIVAEITQNPLWREASLAVFTFDLSLAFTLPALTLGVRYIVRGAKLFYSELLEIPGKRSE